MIVLHVKKFVGESLTCNKIMEASMKKMLIALVAGVTFVIAGVSTSALAVDFADGWMGCTPLVIGPTSGDVMVKLSCTDSSGASYYGWAKLSTTGTNQMMAAFLTAQSLNASLAVHFSGTTTETGGTFAYSEVIGLQLSTE